ncbi:hypothetical protein HK102_005672, partial [Quaeritorhiza haematococci]
LGLEYIRRITCTAHVADADDGEHAAVLAALNATITALEAQVAGLRIENDKMGFTWVSGTARLQRGGFDLTNNNKTLRQMFDNRGGTTYGKDVEIEELNAKINEMQRMLAERFDELTRGHAETDRLQNQVGRNNAGNVNRNTTPAVGRSSNTHNGHRAPNFNNNRHTVANAAVGGRGGVRHGGALAGRGASTGMKILLGVYYALMDIILLGQYFYYTKLYRRRDHQSSIISFNDNNNNTSTDEDIDPSLPTERTPLFTSINHANSQPTTLPKSRSSAPSTSTSTFAPMTAPTKSVAREILAKNRGSSNSTLVNANSYHAGMTAKSAGTPSKSSLSLQLALQAGRKYNTYMAESLSESFPSSYQSRLSGKGALFMVGAVMVLSSTIGGASRRMSSVSSGMGTVLTESGVGGGDGGVVNALMSDLDPSQRFIADLMGYISAALYVGARIPQIYKNWKNKSCEGLSLLMFFFSVAGNVTYCLSIFFNSLDPEYLWINFPWLLGSGGTLVFDFIIFAQFFAYAEKTYERVRDEEDVEA